MKKKIVILTILSLFIHLGAYSKTTSSDYDLSSIQRVRNLTKQKITFDIPLIGLSIDIPQNFNYAIDGRRFDFKNNDTIQIEIETEDLDRDNGVSYDFYGKNYDINLFLINPYAEGPAFHLQTYAEWSEYKKIEKKISDNQSQFLLYCGSKSYGTLYLYLIQENYQAILSFAVYGKDNQEEIDKIIASLKLIDPETKNQLLDANRINTSNLEISAGTLPELDDIKSKLSEPKLNKDVFTTTIKDLGLEFTLPGKIAEDSIQTDVKLDSIQHRQYVQNLKVEVPSEDDSHARSIDLMLAIYYAGDDNDADVRTKLRRQKAKYESMSVVPYAMADVIRFNDLSWSILLYKFDFDYDTYTSLSVETRVGDYVISIATDDLKDLSEAYYLLSYLQTFKIEKAKLQ